MRPRQWLLLRKPDGHTAVIVKVLPNGDLELMDRDTQVRFVWTEKQYDLAIKRGTVVVESSAEKRWTESAIKMGRFTANHQIREHDGQQMSHATAARFYQNFHGFPAWAADIAAAEYTKTWASRPRPNPVLLRFQNPTAGRWNELIKKNGLPEPPGEPIDLRWIARGNDWWVKTEKGWYWLRNGRVWESSTYGPGQTQR